jgi:hypothetical protein
MGNSMLRSKRHACLTSVAESADHTAAHSIERILRNGRALGSADWLW